MARCGWLFGLDIREKASREERGGSGLHNSVAEVRFATSDWHSLGLGQELPETLYPRGFPKLADWWRGPAPGLGCRAAEHAGRQRWAVSQGFHSVKPLSTSRPSPQALSLGGIIWPRSHQEACDPSWLLDPVQGLHQAASGCPRLEDSRVEDRWAQTRGFFRCTH